MERADRTEKEREKMNKQLIAIQSKLKAPKGQNNTFGGYKYRSCEDILEAVKPLLAGNEAQLTLSDEMVAVGDRVYVKATATFTSKDGTEVVTAWAREAESKKGMDASQVTGATSSYARKYALNGLFLIDDTKDADTDEYTARRKMAEESEQYASDRDKKNFMAYCKKLDVDYKEIRKQAGQTNTKAPMTVDEHAKCLMILKEIEESYGK